MMAQGAPVQIVNWGTTSGASPGSSAATSSFEKSVGSDNFATAQTSSSVSPAAATQIVAARAGRRNVTFVNITGTQPVYFLTGARTDGVTTGVFLAGVVGATLTIATSAAVFATSPTAAQTISAIEVY
jgi:hypothetical protein